MGRFAAAVCAALALAAGTASAESWSRMPTCYLRRSTEIRVHSENRMSVREEDEIWIASDNDRTEGYDAFTETAYGTLKKFEGSVFDSTGRLIRTLRNEDRNVSTVSYGAVYSEHRTCFHTLSIPRVPYRVSRVKEYEIRCLLMWPDWNPQAAFPVRDAELKIVCERPVPFRTRVLGGVTGPDSVRTRDGFPAFVWKASGIPPLKKEFRAAPESLFSTGVRFFPQRFNLEGHDGSAEDWTRLGDFYESLFEPRCMLRKTVPLVDECRSLPDPSERVRMLFKAFQESTRYVLIHLGIDGIRPHFAEDVHQNRYGDCKDLSLYLIAMLRQAGVEAYPALVLTRDQGTLDPDMPEGRFNHCVTAVMTGTDTLWLECTSDESWPDNIPPGLEGSSALILRRGKSTFLRIPESVSTANSRHVNASAELTLNRKLAFSGTARYLGDCSEAARERLRSLNEIERRNWFIGTLIPEAGTCSFNSFRIRGLDVPDSALIVSFAFKVPLFLKRAGSRWLIQPRVFNRFLFNGEEPSARKLPLRNPGRFMETDTIRFTIPAGLKVYNGEDSTTIDSPFGRYEDRCRTTQDGFVWTSRLSLERLDVPVSEYREYHHFMKQTGNAVRRKIVLSGIDSSAMTPH